MTMGTKVDKAEETTSTRPQKPRAPQLRMPDNIHPKFGVLAHDDTQAQGVAATSDLAALLNVFGVSDVSNIAFPYQKHGASDGKRFELRVEPSGSHNVGGESTVGHQWIFRQTYPELSA